MITLRALIFIFFISLLLSCKNENKDIDITGTWQLVSAVTIKEGVITNNFNSANEKVIKIINNDHFAFFRHDFNKGKDSATATFVSGAGSYTLTGNKYEEYLEYCNYRDWEKNSFEFNLEIKGDSLIQTGFEEVESLGISHEIVEKFIRIEKK